MKVDFYISSLSSGGAEHVLTNLAANFAAHGMDVSITSYEKRPQFYSVASNVKLNRCDFTNKSKLAEWLCDYRATKKYFRKRKAAVAISFLSRCNFMLILAGLFSKTKIIVCDRNNLLRKYPKYVFDVTCFLYRFADVVCVQTNEMKTFYPQYLQKKIVVLENPLDFDEMVAQCEGQSIEKENTVISVGRLERQKDFVTLIKAYKKVAELYPDWKLKIYGQGNRKDELQNLIEKENLTTSGKLCGVTHTPFLEMKKARIFVLSSFYEGFPNVLCEAMHAGLPCISTKCECGPSELINDGKSGFLVQIGDADQMAEKIVTLVENETLRRTMGEEAEKSTERLSREVICQKWRELAYRLSGEVQ